MEESRIKESQYGVYLVKRFEAEFKEDAPLLVHIPNEQKTSPQRGASLNRQGRRKGFPDYLLLKPRGYYNGLALELKAKGGRLSKEQEFYLTLLRANGFLSVAAMNGIVAYNVIQKYMTNIDDCIRYIAETDEVASFVGLSYDDLEV